MDRYGTPAGFRSYHAARGNDLPIEAADDATVNEWLLVGSEFVDARYCSSFPGLRVGMRDQLREWPRHSAVDRYSYSIASDSVPSEVERATYEAALKHGANPGSLAVDYTPSKYKSVSVEGAVSVQYAQFNSAHEAQTQFGIIDQILSPLFGGCGSTSALSGSVLRV